MLNHYKHTQLKRLITIPKIFYRNCCQKCGTLKTKYVMKGTIEIKDTHFTDLIKYSIYIALGNIDLEKMIEDKVDNRVDDIVKKNLSSEKVENFAKDRVSRIITAERLKDYTSGIDSETVLSNLETKILLMIKNSKEFKTLVKQTVKNSL